MAVHELKSWPEFFKPLESGAKNFELRRNDRGYALGDVLLLREWDPNFEEYTGAELHRRVCYIMEGAGSVGTIAPLKGLAQGFVILGLMRVS